MVRSLYVGSLFALIVGAATIAACSSDGAGGSSTTSSGSTTSTTSSAGGGSTTSTTSSAGGGGASSTTTSTSTTTTTTSSSSGGGAGGTGGQGGAGGAGGQGGANAGGGGGAGGQGGSGGQPGCGADQDCDGWTPAQGDCCDNEIDCGQPALVNPGAFEYLGNGLDDDCDPSTPDDVVPPDCMPANQALVTPTSSLKLIKAMDLCQFTVANPPPEQKKWGVISSSLSLADGTGNIQDVQAGVLADFGTMVTPRKGPTMGAISTGTARDETDAGHVYPQNGLQAGQTGNYNANTQSPIPPAYLAANGGAVPSPAACPVCQGQGCTTAYDSVDLKAKIRVPTNALSFSYNFKFYSAEYPEYVCQQYNDFFITLLTTSYQCAVPGSPDCIPADHNIALDSLGSPVSVNNAFFEVCFPPPGAPPGTCPDGTLDLLGTGYGGWSGNLKDGGGTVWLQNDANVTPGETIDLEFILWDSGDSNVDSLVVLDKFRWNVTPSTVGVHK